MTAQTSNHEKTAGRDALICKECGRVKAKRLTVSGVACSHEDHVQTFAVTEDQLSQLRDAAREYRSASGYAERAAAASRWVAAFELLDQEGESSCMC